MQVVGLVGRLSVFVRLLSAECNELHACSGQCIACVCPSVQTRHQYNYSHIDVQLKRNSQYNNLPLHSDFLFIPLHAMEALGVRGGIAPTHS
jgi:hypothetical protein